MHGHFIVLGKYSLVTLLLKVRSVYSKVYRLPCLLSIQYSYLAILAFSPDLLFYSP